jgi:hypothetical protein
MRLLLLLLCCSPAAAAAAVAHAAAAASNLRTGRGQRWQLRSSTSTDTRGLPLLELLRGAEVVLVASWASPVWVQAKPNPSQPLPSFHTGDALAAVQAVSAVDGPHAPAAAAPGCRHKDALVGSVGACRHGRALEARLLLLLYAEPRLERPCAAAAQAKCI